MSDEHPLRLWRKAHKISLQDLATAVGRHASHLSQLENGTKGVSLETAVAIEVFTGGAVPTSSLVREVCK